MLMSVCVCVCGIGMCCSRMSLILIQTLPKRILRQWKTSPWQENLERLGRLLPGCTVILHLGGFHFPLHYLVESPIPATGREPQPHFTEDIQAQRGRWGSPQPHPSLMMALDLTLTCTALWLCLNPGRFIPGFVMSQLSEHSRLTER